MLDVIKQRIEDPVGHPVGELFRGHRGLILSLTRPISILLVVGRSGPLKLGQHKEGLMGRIEEVTHHVDE